MTRLKKTSLLLCFILVLQLLPSVAFAKDFEITWFDMDFRTVNKDVSKSTWDWDVKSKTLTLEDFHGYVEDGIRENNAAILLPENSTIKLIGENSLSTASDRCRGFYSEGGKLEIEGNGSLDITIDSADASAFFLDNGGAITFGEKVEIAVETDGPVIYITGARGNDPLISVLRKATVSFSRDIGSKAIYVVKKSNTETSDNWFNYDEDFDKSTDSVVLVKKPTTEAAEDTTEDEAILAAYRVAIGNSSISKDGVIVYNGDAPAFISENNFTMLPLRALITALGVDTDIAWNASTKTATVVFNEHTYLITAGNGPMIKDGEKVDLYAPAQIEDRRAFLSLRDWMAILEIPSEQVSWDSVTKTVTLNY